MESTRYIDIYKSFIYPFPVKWKYFTLKQVYGTGCVLGDNYYARTFFINENNQKVIISLQLILVLIQQVGSPRKWPLMQSFDVFFIVSMSELLNRLSSCRCLRRHGAHITVRYPL